MFNRLHVLVLCVNVSALLSVLMAFRVSRLVRQLFTHRL